MISPKEIRVLRYDHDRHLSDLAAVQTREMTTNSYGEAVYSYTTVGTYACGFAFSPFKFRAREANSQVTEGVSEIFVRARFSYDAVDSIERDGRVILVRRYGIAVSPPETYEVQGFAEQNISGIIVNLKRVEM